MDDATLTRAQAGDRQAAGRLYECYHTRIFRYLTYRVGDAATAEDLTAGVFERMVRALPTYRREQGTFQAWLFGIARNLSVDHLRRANRRRLLPLGERLPGTAASPEAAASAHLTADTLTQALTRLNDDQREVVILRFVAEMPIAEVAAAIGRSEDAVKGLQRRGLAALRGALSEMGVTYGEA